MSVDETDSARREASGFVRRRGRAGRRRGRRGGRRRARRREPGQFPLGEGYSKQQKADAFITADLKYHQFYQGVNNLLLLDVGHYESEQFTKNLIFDYLTKKMPNFAIVLSSIKTNPVNYF